MHVNLQVRSTYRSWMCDVLVFLHFPFRISPCVFFSAVMLTHSNIKIFFAITLERVNLTDNFSQSATEFGSKWDWCHLGQCNPYYRDPPQLAAETRWPSSISPLQDNGGGFWGLRRFCPLNNFFYSNKSTSALVHPSHSHYQPSQSIIEVHFADKYRLYVYRERISALIFSVNSESFIA